MPPEPEMIPEIIAKKAKKSSHKHSLVKMSTASPSSTMMAMPTFRDQPLIHLMTYLLSSPMTKNLTQMNPMMDMMVSTILNYLSVSNKDYYNEPSVKKFVKSRKTLRTFNCNPM